MRSTKIALTTNNPPSKIMNFYIKWVQTSNVIKGKVWMLILNSLQIGRCRSFLDRLKRKVSHTVGQREYVFSLSNRYLRGNRIFYFYAFFNKMEMLQFLLVKLTVLSYFKQKRTEGFILFFQQMFCPPASLLLSSLQVNS